MTRVNPSNWTPTVAVCCATEEYATDEHAVRIFSGHGTPILHWLFYFLLQPSQQALVLRQYDLTDVQRFRATCIREVLPTLHHLVDGAFPNLVSEPHITGIGSEPEAKMLVQFANAQRGMESLPSASHLFWKLNWQPTYLLEISLNTNQMPNQIMPV